MRFCVTLVKIRSDLFGLSFSYVAELNTLETVDISDSVKKIDENAYRTK